jgi:hypothetical protein
LAAIAVWAVKCGAIIVERFGIIETARLVPAALPVAVRAALGCDDFAPPIGAGFTPTTEVGFTVPTGTGFALGRASLG